MKIQTGDVVNFQIQPRTLLAGREGVCRIDSFEKSRRGRVVYIDLQQEDGSFVERFMRLWPFEIAFAPVGTKQYETYMG